MSAPQWQRGSERRGLHHGEKIDGSWRHVAAELLKQQAARLAMLTDKQFFSASPDASKVSHIGVLFCPVSERENGKSMWAAPIVRQGIRAKYGGSQTSFSDS